MIPWGLILRALALVAALGAVWYAKTSYDERRRDEGRAEVAARWDEERAVQRAALERRRAEDERAAGVLRAREAESHAARQFAEARLAAAGDEIAALGARLRAGGAGGSLPADVRRVWNDAAGYSGGERAPAIPAAAPDAAPATGAPAGAGGEAPGGVAPPRADAEPVECVTVFEAGARNTARVVFNAAALMSCQRDQIALWEACTGQQYPTRELAPWLIQP